MRWLRRKWYGYRACGVRACPKRRSKRGLGTSAWCDDHHDAIIASGTHKFGIPAARRLGPRRWALKAEVDVELEAKSAVVLADILAMTPAERSYPSNRYCWDEGAVKLSARVDELLALGENCPDDVLKAIARGAP